MNYYRLLILGSCCSTFITRPLFEHDRAVSAYQAGQYAQARDYMKTVVAGNPTDPTCLYDAGVVAYKNADIDQADAYFSTVTQQPHVPDELLEKAHFNRAKVYEKRIEYQQAIEQYTRVLQINPDNNKAKEEKARLEKLLEKKKQEEKQEQEKKENKQQQQQNQQEQQSSDKDTKQDKQQQGDESANPQQTQDKGQEKSSQQQAGEQHTDKQNAQQNGQQEPFNNEKHTKKQPDNTVDKQPEHTKNPQQEMQNNKSIAQKGADEQQQRDASAAGMPSPKKMDAMLERILAEQEQQDALLNKKFIKATVKQNMAGRNDQNCW